MDTLSFSIFPNDNFLDLRLYQYGWEQCAPLHSFGPFVRNHYLFHYVISGRGMLDSNDADGVTHHAFDWQGAWQLVGMVLEYRGTPWGRSSKVHLHKLSSWLNS